MGCSAHGACSLHFLVSKPEYCLNRQGLDIILASQPARQCTNACTHKRWTNKPGAELRPRGNEGSGSHSLPAQPHRRSIFLFYFFLASRFGCVPNRQGRLYGRKTSKRVCVCVSVCAYAWFFFFFFFFFFARVGFGEVHGSPPAAPRPLLGHRGGVTGPVG
ncbi:hypothetical protein LX36DRAFT_346695 [Colletotrichum falcatum]|nr:hypothetical protein LX36DRAFT_346695 [Colletotrichum falcatum]